jgi:hypothetical protein
MTEMGRHFDVEQVQEFEHAIRRHFAAESNRVLDGCVLISALTVEISLDTAGQDFLKKHRETQRKRRLIEETHRTDLLEQSQTEQRAALGTQHEIELDRLRRDFENETKRQAEEYAARLRRDEEDRAAELRYREERRQAELRRDEEEWAAELKRRQDREQLENEKVRTALYLEAIKNGDAAVLAMHLGRHPDDAKEIIQMIVQNQALNEERQAKLLADMIDKELIIGTDLDGLNQDLIRSVMGLQARRTGGVFSLNTTIDVSVAELADHTAANADGDDDDDEKESPAREDGDD